MIRGSERHHKAVRCVRGRLSWLMDDVDRANRALMRDNAAGLSGHGQHVPPSAPAVKRRVDRLERDGVLPATRRSSTRGVRLAGGAFVDLFCDGNMSAAAIKRAVSREAAWCPRTRWPRGQRPAARDELATPRPRARAGADPRHRGGHADRDRRGPLDPVRAMRRPFPTADRPRSATSWPREHIRNAAAVRGREVQRPVPDPGLLLLKPSHLPGRPGRSQARRHSMLDYELELACVIGEEGRPRASRS